MCVPYIFRFCFNSILFDFLLKESECEIEWSEISAIDERSLKQLEADCYGCMTKLLDRIQENYVFSQPGIQKKVQALGDLIKRIDGISYGLLTLLKFQHKKF
jgi:hypothetical protein